MAYFPLGPLAPDRAPRLNDKVLRVADGVYPTVDGYKPVGQWTQAFSALAASPKGGASFVSHQGVTSIVAGTATALYRAYSGAWQLLASGYSIQGGQRWRFAQFGGLAIATNAADPMQKINLETMIVSPLGGTPPKFEALGVVKGFLVGTCMDGDGMTIAWSGAFNAEAWEFGTGQSDYYTIPSGGRVNGILSGEFGLILQRNRIVRLDYVGGNLIFEPNEVSTNIGCVSVHSVAQWGSLGFWLSDSGFVMWDGTQPILIGDGEVDDEFRVAYDVSDLPNMSTAIDPIRKVVMWSVGTKVYCYHWLIKRWSTITYAAPILFSGVTKEVTLDEQDITVGATDDNVDGAALLGFDNAMFEGGDPRLYVFSGANALGTFDGLPMQATFGMNDLELAPGVRANVVEARPDIDCVTGLTLTIEAKQRLADAASSAAYTTLRDSGDMPVRSSGRYIRPTLVVAAGTAWTHARGIAFKFRRGAGR